MKNTNKIQRVYHFKLAQRTFQIFSTITSAEVDELIVMLSLYRQQAIAFFIRPLTVEVCRDNFSASKEERIDIDDLISYLMDLSNDLRDCGR